jgi:5'-deoxynucleotidase YfbR-like HD superfamily hydrolase
MNSPKETINSFFNHGYLDFLLYRVSSITRYNTRKFVYPQTVLEHEGAVTQIAMLLSDYLNSVGIVNDTEKVLRLSITHDNSEVVSGDIPHSAKYQAGRHSDELREALNHLNDNVMENMCSLIKIPEIQEYYMKLYQEEKEKQTLEAKICKLADFADVIIYANEEMKLGNQSIITERDNAQKRFDELLDSVLKK